MAEQKLMNRRRVSLMIMVFIFQVLSASFHGCFVAAGHVQPPWKKSTIHPTTVNSFGSSVFFSVSGNVYPLGYYSVTVGIGNPPKPFQLDIDTGSDLTWVQCDAPCSGCTLPRDHLYKPVKNNYLACKDPICAALNSPKGNPCKNLNDKCGFQVEYADHGSVLGVMVSDNFPMPLVNGTRSSPLLAFGCGYRLQNRGPHAPPTTAGVLGLGKTELLFGGKPTGVKGFNVIFDTGATYTYLSSNVYQTVVNLIKKDLTGKPLQEVKDNALPICWKGPNPFKSVQDVKKYFNRLALSFGGTNTQLQLPPEAYLIVTERGNVCLGILNGAEAGLGTSNVIGDISLQDKLVIYNNENQRIGWAAADCARKLR
ncbi:Peptidase A1 [Corchorus olitorius]|uniref:Peptidase A1 n=1 Tax=Corchorus olitorius TaxID=93759 RepID=A0A1R3I7G6_9ROSI|nr:Peptidase A1 [Corchorus olitorius]